MPRRLVLPLKKIYENRGTEWQFHYENRLFVSSLCVSGWNGVEVALALHHSYPKPELMIDGSLLDVPLSVRREHEANFLSRFRLPRRNLLCSWYWTESGWSEFYSMYQALPDVYEDYYYKYEPEPNDRFRLVPMSCKPKQGEKVQSSQIYVDNPVDNPMDKSGTGRRQKVQVG